MAKVKESKEISILEVKTGLVEFCVLGLRPMIMRRMAEKGPLLLPHKKTKVEKESNAKHNPYKEYRDSPYTFKEDDAPTFLAQLATCFKKAIMGAALDIPGATKSQIGRLLWIEGERISIYGIPKIFISVTRNADMNRTPDIRTRSIVPEWACSVRVSYMQPMLKEQVIANLFAIAGLTNGIGDWRPQKGSGTFGQFKLVSKDDPDYKRIMKTGGREAQMKAMETPVPYDDETEELLRWFDAEYKRLGFKEVV